MADAWEEAMMRAMGGRAAASAQTYESGASRPSAPRKRPASDDIPAKTSKKAHKTKLPAAGCRRRSTTACRACFCKGDRKVV